MNGVSYVLAVARNHWTTANADSSKPDTGSPPWQCSLALALLAHAEFGRDYLNAEHVRFHHTRAGTRSGVAAVATDPRCWRRAGCPGGPYLRQDTL